MDAGKSRIKVNPWLIAAAVIVPTFMEVLDTTVVSVSLPNIAGNLSATNTEATWVQTSYLISNAVVLPASAWFSSFFGRKRFLLACIAIFTIASFICGMAPSLAVLIFARVIQGAGGGALQPISQAILLESFPPRETWRRHGRLRFWSHHGPGDGTRNGRVDYRPLLVALAVLHESPHWPSRRMDDPPVRLRPGLHPKGQAGPH